MNFGHWNGWSLVWLGWILYFLGVEFYALGSGHPENTLSDQVWRLEGTFGPPWTWTPAHWAFVIFYAGLSVWLLGHFDFHIWR